MAFDIAIIGGGVVGCATLYELTNKGYNCILLEKNEALLAEASSGNSGMFHTGFDAVGVELDCIRVCQSKVFDVTTKLGVPVMHIGATLVAWNQSQLAMFPELIQRSNTASVCDIYEWSPSQLYQHEPHLLSGALGALNIPGETVTDPWLFPICLANCAEKKEAKIILNARVLSCTKGVSSTDIETTLGHVKARCVVNCGGLYGDIVENMITKPSFRILPRKGQYTVYDKTARGLISSSILPVPSKVGKGIIVFKSVYDNVIVGPTAENVESRDRAPIDNEITKRLLNVARQTVKTLDKHPVVSLYTGVRPATEFKDYIIKADKERNWITVGGIRSTGLSGCLGIADRVRYLVEDTLGVEASKGINSVITKPEVHFSRFGTAIIDGIEHKITHPLTLAGVKRNLTKL